MVSRHYAAQTLTWRNRDAAHDLLVPLMRRGFLREDALALLNGLEALGVGLRAIGREVSL